ncbi:hypothetical protein [Williamsia muralis]|uniref:hypothetical protein n=1 Tax=Williamsia marianensis TaxID=85044 RepID=UPI000DE69C79|nr:hypothetical protein [Williamsia marianensis]PVY33006.1 hypothetical protein C7458_102764 [Williamsia marianensis]
MSARDKTIALIGALALVLLIVVALGYALLAGRDVASYAPTLLGFATPVIVTLFAASGAKVEMGKIQAKVNGNYDELAQRNEELAAALAQVSEQFTATTGQMPAVETETAARAVHPDENVGRHRLRGDYR